MSSYTELTVERKYIMNKEQFIEHLAEIWKYSKRVVSNNGKETTVVFTSLEGQKFIAMYKLDSVLWKEIQPLIIEKAKEIK